MTHNIQCTYRTDLVIRINKTGKLSSLEKVKLSRYTPWRRMRGEEV
jgi:hypothetical protein